MSIAEPALTDPDGSGDTVMSSADDDGGNTPHPARSQFTQTLMLFSQVQGGARYRYSPHLTRFFAALLPRALLALVQAALTEMGVKQNAPKELLIEDDAEDGGEGVEEVPMLRMRIGTKDRRKIHMKGHVEIEEMRLVGYTGSFVVFARDVVSRAGCCSSFFLSAACCFFCVCGLG